MVIFANLCQLNNPVVYIRVNSFDRWTECIIISSMKAKVSCLQFMMELPIICSCPMHRLRGERIVQRQHNA